MRQAAMLAKERGLSALTRQILFRLERGQIKTPEPDVFRAAASLYRLSYDDLVNRWSRAHFYGAADESGTGRADSSAPHTAHTTLHPRPEEDRDLLGDVLVDRDTHAANLAPSREAFERVVGELAVLIKQLPRGSHAVARPDRSGGPGSRGRDRPKHGQKHPKKPARE